MSDEDEEPKTKHGASLADAQKAHLSKLMANPEKPVSIPEAPKERGPRDPPEFVRFYMGSSAGAGSEVFHVYRHLRRRENDRQAFIQNCAGKEIKDIEFQEKLMANKLAADQRTSKKRAKRLKRKGNKAQKKQVEETDEDEAAKNEKKEQDEGSEEDEQSHFVVGGR